MIEERALVCEAGEGFAWVETRRPTTCAACGVSQACGTATLARLFGNRRARMRVLSGISLQAGDEVMIGIDEAALIRGSLAVYMAPLVAMFLGALAGDWISAGRGEEPIIVLGMLGLSGGFTWVRRFSRGIRAERRFQPVVLRRVASTYSHAGHVLLP